MHEIQCVTVSIFLGSAFAIGGAATLLKRGLLYLRSYSFSRFSLVLLLAVGLVLFLFAWFLGFLVGGGIGGALGSKIAEEAALPTGAMTCFGILLGIPVVTVAVFSVYPLFLMVLAASFGRNGSG